MENKPAAAKNVDLSLTSTEGAKALYQIANMMAESDIIPDAFKRKPANVLIALNMANRLQADPLMVMQNLYIVYGNPGWSSKFLIACFNTCGRFSSIKYEFFGKSGTDSYGCRAYATELATKEKVVSIDVTMGMANAEGWASKKGSKWQTMPQLMLQYRAATFLIRTVAPEISMGLQTTEELIETIDVTPGFDVEPNIDNSMEAIAGRVEQEAAEAPTPISMAAPRTVVTPDEEPAPVPRTKPF